MPTHWIVTASADHAARGKRLGIVQAGHGKDAPLRRMQPGDGVVIYSPRATYPDGPPLQAFTLIGRIAAEEPWQHDTFGPLMWARKVAWQDTGFVPIRPLLDDLEITRGLKSWWMAFRHGLTKITPADFDRIAGAIIGAPTGPT